MRHAQADAEAGRRARGGLRQAVHAAEDVQLTDTSFEEMVAPGERWFVRLYVEGASAHAAGMALAKG